MSRTTRTILAALAVLLLLWLFFGCTAQAQAARADFELHAHRQQATDASAPSAADCVTRPAHNESLIAAGAPAGVYTVIGNDPGEDCYGRQEHPGGTLAMAIWEDDPDTEAKDGASDGEPLTLHRDGAPLVALPHYSRDAVVWVATAPADTILAALAEAAALLDSLETAAQALADDLEAAEARADFEYARAEAFKAAALEAATERNAARDSLQAVTLELEEERAERQALIDAAVAEAVAEATAALEAENAALRAERAAALAAILQNNSRLSQILRGIYGL